MPLFMTVQNDYFYYSHTDHIIDLLWYRVFLLALTLLNHNLTEPFLLSLERFPQSINAKTLLLIPK